MRNQRNGKSVFLKTSLSINVNLQKKKKRKKEILNYPQKTHPFSHFTVSRYTRRLRRFLSSKENPSVCAHNSSTPKSTRIPNAFLHFLPHYLPNFLLFFFIFAHLARTKEQSMAALYTSRSYGSLARRGELEKTKVYTTHTHRHVWLAQTRKSNVVERERYTAIMEDFCPRGLILLLLTPATCSLAGFCFSPFRLLTFLFLELARI